jgi:peptidoglycan/LPS O-acetylase OafA/YrhL
VTFQERLAVTSNRGPSFDHIRLIAATIVLLHHCRGTAVSDIRVDPLFHYSNGYMHFGLLAVIVFFAVSGFLVTPSLVHTGNVIQYAVHRSLRIFPALFVVVGVSMLLLGPALTTFSLQSYFSDPQLYTYAKNAVTLTQNYLPGVTTSDGQPANINGALWTLHFEGLSYVALALLSITGFVRRRILFLMMFTGTYITYVALRLGPAIIHGFSGRFVTFMDLFVYFAAGAALYIFRDRVPFSWAVAFLAFALLIAGLPYGLGPVIMPLSLTYITMYFGLSVLPGKRLLKRDLSYGIYLIHAPILIALTVLFPNLPPWGLLAGIVFLISLILSYFSWIFVEGPALRQKRAVSRMVNCWIDAILASWSKPKRE